MSPPQPQVANPRFRCVLGFRNFRISENLSTFNFKFLNFLTSFITYEVQVLLKLYNHNILDS